MKDFIPYEQAIALKELGFDEPCFGYYDSKSTLTISTNKTVAKDWVWIDNSIVLIDMTLAPTFSQAFRWFREKYKLRSTIIPYWIGDTYMTIIEGKMIDEIEPKQFQTYEEAELACLVELIEITKQNG